MQVESQSNPKEIGPRWSGSIEYRTLTELDQVAWISSEWDALLETSRCNRAYSCSKWYMATVELFPELQPLVFVAYRAGVLAGILPLWLNVSRRLARFGDYYSDHTDIIVPDEDSELSTRLLAYALQGNGSYDRVDLGQVKRDSNCVRAAKALGLTRMIEEFFSPGKCLIYAVLDLTSGYEEYIKTLSRNFRESLCRAARKAENDGMILSELTPAELNPELLPETFLSLHLSRFGENTNFKSSEIWMQKLFPALFSERRLRVFALLDKGRIAGIDLEMVARSGFYSYNGGFLPEVRRYAPGKLLIHKAIQQACIDGMDEYDLGWWSQEYKADWRPGTREIGKLQFDVLGKRATLA